jgi:inorganic phosphate transporter, PiT family
VDPFVLIILVILFALVFNMSVGWNDAANAIATVVSTRVLSPVKAVLFGAVLNFAGALFSSEVARTVGQEIADPRHLTLETFLAATIVAPIWIGVCTLRGLPISGSHSLLGALVGAVIATAGPETLKSEGIHKILFGVVSSPIIGFGLGFALMILIAWLVRTWRPSVISRWFGRFQLLSAGAMAFGHGTGDAQKAMGIITACLIAAGYPGLLNEAGRMVIPMWVRLACAVTMFIGTAWGGRHVIRTLGMSLARLKPIHGFAAETAGAVTILANTLTGVPISTTHSITAAIMGVGATRGMKAVKWGVGRRIVFAWIVTFPVCIAGGYLLYEVMKLAWLK